MQTVMASYDYQTIIHQMKERLNVDFVGIAMPSDLISQTNIKWQFVSGETNKRYKLIELQRGKGIAGQVIKSGKPWIELDVDHSELTSHIFDFPIVKFERLTSFISIPLWKYNKVAAVLLIGNRGHHKFDSNIMKDVEKSLTEGFGPFYRKDTINHG